MGRGGSHSVHGEDCPPGLFPPSLTQHGAQDKNLHIFGRAALPRRPGIQGRAAALPYHDGEDSCPAPRSMWLRVFRLRGRAFPG